MIGRRLNEPAGKIGTKFPVFWLREVGTDWYCRQCSKSQKKDSVVFEVLVREAAKGVKNPSEGVKLFMCLPCAQTMIEEVQQKIALIHNTGVDGYKLITKAV